MRTLCGATMVLLFLASTIIMNPPRYMELRKEMLPLNQVCLVQGIFILTLTHGGRHSNLLDTENLFGISEHSTGDLPKGV